MITDRTIFHVPAFVARHNDPIVRSMIPVVERVFSARGDLRSGKYDRNGVEILPPLPEWLKRPPKRGKDESAEDFERRRADGMQAVCAVWLTILGSCDWLTMEVIDWTKGGYLSVERLQELSEMTSDRTWRALQKIKLAGVISFTKQHREKKPDGKCRSTGPALRRISKDSIRRLGPVTGDRFDKRIRKLKRRKEKAQRKAEEKGYGVEPHARQLTRNLVSALDNRRHAAAGPTPPSSPPLPRRVPPELIDAIAAEHPDWNLGRIITEGRRQLGLDTS